jgi:NADH-quinone oxidoreductase subunit J
MMSVLSLLASFFALSLIYLLAGMQFLAAAQILVYAGAILVLFLFVIMLLNLGQLAPESAAGTHPLQGRKARVAAALALAIGLMGLIAAQRSTLATPDAAATGAGIDDIAALAGELFGRYGLALEAAAMLLLATMIAVIVLAKRQRRSAKGEVV